MTLQQEMAQLLVEMALLQHGSTVSYNPSGSGQPESRAPSGDGRPLADVWRDEWVARPFRETVDAARAELEAWKKRQAPALTDESTLEDWVLADGEGYAVAQVAGKFGLAEARVRRIRLKAGRESEFGQVVDVKAEKDRSEERVAYLADRGCSWKQISDQTGLHKTQVQRILARRRKAA